MCIWKRERENATERERERERETLRKRKKKNKRERKSFHCARTDQQHLALLKTNGMWPAGWNISCLRWVCVLQQLSL